MKKIGDLMNEMGFRIQASENSKKAFIKYLGKVSRSRSTELDFLNECEPDEWSARSAHQEPLQLSFNFENETKAS
jgi:hypothetical protein